MTYAIDDKHRNELAAGFASKSAARERAHELASQRNQCVWLYEVETGDSEEITPDD